MVGIADAALAGRGASGGPSGSRHFGVIQAVAPSLRVEVDPLNVRDAGRNRARRRGLRALFEWRSDSDGGQQGDT